MSHPSIVMSVAVLLVSIAAPARATVNVVTTTEGLAAVVGEIGGDKVKVTALSRGIQDPHFVDANPSLAVKLRNAAIQPGAARRLTAGSFVSPMDLPTGPVDRSQGDIHPSGNPHFLSDPRRAVQVAEAIAARLSEIDPASAPYFEARLQAFRGKVSAAEKGWKAQLAPLAGRSVITQHKTLTYLLDWAGLKAAGYLEPKPGVAPPPSHVAGLASTVKSAGVKGVLVENYYDPRSANQLRDLSGVKVILIPGDVGGTKSAPDYLSWVDTLVKSLAQAVQ